MSKKVKIPLIIVLVLLFLTSMAAVAYPYISNYLAEQRQAEIVLKYDEVIEAAGSTENSKALEAARAYNTALANGQTDDIADYNALLDLTGNGMMGIIKIPAIGVELPIYHGTQSLELGALHLQGTSLPVGGASTHCVISAHSGMSTEVMFTDLDQLAEGDVHHLVLTFLAVLALELKNQHGGRAFRALLQVFVECRHALAVMELELLQEIVGVFLNLVSIDAGIVMYHDLVVRCQVNVELAAPEAVVLCRFQ